MGQYYPGERIYFKAIEQSDESFLRGWLSDPRNWATLGRVLPIGQAREREWIDGLYKEGGDVVFLIVHRQSDRPIGSTGLHRVHAINRTAVLGLLIGDVEYQGQGYGTEACRLLLKYGFEELNLNRIELGVLATNRAGVRAYEKAGLLREGCFRQACFRNGRYVDELRYAVLREDWAMRNPLPADNGRSVQARVLLNVSPRAVAAGVA